MDALYNYMRVCLKRVFMNPFKPNHVKKFEKYPLTYAEFYFYGSLYEMTHIWCLLRLGSKVNMYDVFFESDQECDDKVQESSTDSPIWFKETIPGKETEWNASNNKRKTESKFGKASGSKVQGDIVKIMKKPMTEDLFAFFFPFPVRHESFE